MSVTKRENTVNRFQNIEGMRFGRLIAVRETERVKSGSRLWVCQCDCGKAVTVRRHTLVIGKTQSCGCLQKDRVSEYRTINIPIGKQFDRLKVAAKADFKSKYGDIMWVCQCDCGNVVTVAGKDLKSRHTRTCGCSRKRPKGVASFNKLYGDYSRNAERREIKFELTKEQFAALTKQDCHYCGVKPEKARKSRPGENGEYIYNGIDRVDNSKGYTADNVVPCCELCNKAKNKYGLEVFETWLKRIALQWYPIAKEKKHG